jgi:hypothetical protein
MKITRMIVRAASAAMVTAMVVPVVAISAASASENDGVPESREFVLYYNSNQKGGSADILHSRNFTGLAFGGAGTSTPGFGYFVRDNVASVWNRHPTKTARVYVAFDYQGAFDTIPPNTKRNLVTTYNRDKSFQFLQP